MSVQGCNTLARTDHLRNHWNSLVLYEKNGKPADLSKDGDTCVRKKGVKEHTLFFKENGYSKQNLPPINPILSNAVTHLLLPHSAGFHSHRLMKMRKTLMTMLVKVKVPVVSKM